MSDINKLVFEGLTDHIMSVGLTPKEVFQGQVKGHEVGSAVGRAIGGAAGHIHKFAKENPEMAAAAGGGLAAAYLTRNHIKNRG